MLPGGSRLNIADKTYNGWMTLIDKTLPYDLDDQVIQAENLSELLEQ